jgi:quercetin dioxygenase-like cupin family protein
MSIIVYKASEAGYIPALAGVKRKTLLFGEKTLMTEFKLKGGHVLPVHCHPQEQTGYLVSGHILLSIDGEEFDILPGDAWTVRGSLPHGAKIIADAVAIEVFSPVREDYKD